MWLNKINLTLIAGKKGSGITLPCSCSQDSNIWIQIFGVKWLDCTVLYFVLDNQVRAK